MIKLIAFLSLFLLNIQILLSQEFTAPDLHKIEIRTARGKRSVWPGLVKRALSNDPTMNNADFTDLYYGQLYQPGYQTWRVDSSLERIKQLSNIYPDSAIEQLRTRISLHPVDLDALYGILILLTQKQDTSEYIRWNRYYKGLLGAIQHSGDGTPGNPFVIINIRDQYKVLIENRTRSTSEVYDKQCQCDVQQLEIPNVFKKDKLYFRTTTSLVSN